MSRTIPRKKAAAAAAWMSVRFMATPAVRLLLVLKWICLAFPAQNKHNLLEVSKQGERTAQKNHNQMYGAEVH